MIDVEHLTKRYGDVIVAGAVSAFAAIGVALAFIVGYAVAAVVVGACLLQRRDV